MRGVSENRVLLDYAFVFSVAGCAKSHSRPSAACSSRRPLRRVRPAHSAATTQVSAARRPCSSRARVTYWGGIRAELGRYATHGRREQRELPESAFVEFALEEPAPWRAHEVPVWDGHELVRRIGTRQGRRHAATNIARGARMDVLVHAKCGDPYPPPQSPSAVRIDAAIVLPRPQLHDSTKCDERLHQSFARAVHLLTQLQGHTVGLTDRSIKVVPEPPDDLFAKGADVGGRERPGPVCARQQISTAGCDPRVGRERESARTLRDTTDNRRQRVDVRPCWQSIPFERRHEARLMHPARIVKVHVGVCQHALVVAMAMQPGEPLQVEAIEAHPNDGDIAWIRRILRETKGG